MDSGRTRAKEVLVWVKERLMEAEAEAKSKETAEGHDEPEVRDDGSDGSNTGGNADNVVGVGLLPEYPDLKALYDGEHEAFIRLLEPLWEKQTRAMEDHMVYLRSNSRSGLGGGGTHRKLIAALVE